MRLRILSLMLWAMAAKSQTLGQVRLLDFAARTPCTVQSVSGGGVNLTLSSPCTIATGTAVFIYPPMTAATAVASQLAAKWARGYYIVTQTDSTHYVLATEMYSNTDVTSSAAAAGDKIVPLTTYYVRQGPKLFLDGPIQKGTWSSATTYRADDSVTYSGSTYMSIADGNKNHTPTDTAWWTPVNPSLLGPGTFSASLRDTSSKGKANSSNRTYQQLQTSAASRRVGWDYDISNVLMGTGGNLNAWNWFANGDSTAYSYAMALANRAEDLAIGGVLCTTGTAYCGRGANLDYARIFSGFALPGLAAIYDTLTPSQKADATNRWLNDLSSIHNGIESESASNCTPLQYTQVNTTITYNNNIVTGSGFSSMPDLQPGSVLYYLFAAGTQYPIGRVKSVDSDTQITLETGYQVQNATRTTWFYTHPFGYSGEHTCGVIYFLRHHPSSPYMTPTQTSTYFADIQSTGTTDSWANNNRTITALMPYIEAGLIFANDDLRGVRLAEQAINYYMAFTEAFAYKSRSTGFNGHGTAYGTGRVEQYRSIINVALKNSLTVTPPGVLTGVSSKSVISNYQYASLLGAPYMALPWDLGYGMDGSGGYGALLPNNVVPAPLMDSYLFPSEPTIPQLYDWLRNRRTDWFFSSEHNGWTYFVNYPILWAFWDPSITPASPSNLPLQHAAIQTDEDECIAAALMCRPDTGEYETLSQTGWGASDTQVIVHGNTSLPIYNEDGYGEANVVEIAQSKSPSSFNATNNIKSAYLLGGNGAGAGGYGSGTSPSSGVSEGNSLSINNGSVDLWATSSIYSKIDRWAGDPQNGVADNSYAYTHVNNTPKIRTADKGYSSSPADLTQVSSFLPSANATNAGSDVLHLKSGSGNPSYVVVYDYVQATTANHFQRYWHYQTADMSAVRHPGWITTYDANNKVVVLTHPGIGRLSSRFLAVPGSANATVAIVRDDRVETWCQGTDAGHNPEAVCTGNYPHFAGLSTSAYAIHPGTYRVTLCASEDGTTCANETSGEWISVHKPSTKETDTMPTITQPACTATGGSCTALEIQDSSYPKVAVLARQGALVQAINFTTTHSGSASYVVSGLAPGSYDVNVNGSRVANRTVVAGDSTLSFSSGSGTIWITASSGPGPRPGPGVRAGGASQIRGQAVIH